MCRWFDHLQRSKAGKILKLILKSLAKLLGKKTSEIFLNSYKKKEKWEKSNKILDTIPTIKLTI